MSMRDLFPGHYPASKDIWNSAWFVLDTSALLTLYEVTEETRKEYFELLERIKDRLWMPYHVCEEYHRGRVNVISRHISDLKDALEKVEDIESDLESKKLAPKDNEPFSLLKETLISMGNLYKDYLEHDPIRDRLNSLFGDHIGAKPDEKKYEAIIKAGSERYKNRIPPGYLDDGKQGNQKYGDLFIWNQIIDFAKDKRRPIIFITNDVKDDWCVPVVTKKGKEPLIFHLELRDEMLREAKVDYWQYNLEAFYKQASEYLQRSIKPEVNEDLVSAAKAMTLCFAPIEVQNLGKILVPELETVQFADVQEAFRAIADLGNNYQDLIRKMTDSLTQPFVDMSQLSASLTLQMPTLVLGSQESRISLGVSNDEIPDSDETSEESQDVSE